MKKVNKIKNEYASVAGTREKMRAGFKVVMSMDNNYCNRSRAYKHSLLALGVIIAVAVATFADVQILVSRIDPSNPDTWPNMGPQVKLFFIPIYAIPFCMLTSVFVSIYEKKHRKTSSKSWFLQGTGFGLIALLVPITSLGLPLLWAFPLVFLTSILLISIIRTKY